MSDKYFLDPRKKKINKDLFRKDNKSPEALYGLPVKIKFCKLCVISNQRPNSTVEYKNKANKSKKKTISFDEDRICDACKANALKKDIDWTSREKELEELCNKYRKNNGEYDCIVPGSGGKDSAYASWILKYKFGMHPLTVTWAPNLYTDWGRENFEKWIGGGFDNQLYTPNIKTHRILTRIATENLLHPFQPFIIGQKMLAPKLARLLNIPLVFYGENEAEYGNPKSDLNTAKRSHAFHSLDIKDDIFLGGMNIKDIQEIFSLSRNDFKIYLPENNLYDHGSAVEVHYLGYYVKWHPQETYYRAVKNYGFKPCPHRNPGTYSTYNSLDDKIDDLHYYTTFIKFGIGRATYDASQEIRNDDIRRYEALNLVKKFDGEYPKRFMSELMNYLSLPEKEFPGASKLFEKPEIDEEYFKSLCELFKSPHIWSFENKWKLKKAVWYKNE
jgi:N-acetyl sugar amidotransferase